MTAQARGVEPDPSDPAEILRLLPERHHAQFHREYAIAIEQARRPEQYRMLRELLRLWRLRAIAYSDPGFASRQASAGSAAADDVPVEQVISGSAR
jgi:hypothetical protein